MCTVSEMIKILRKWFFTVAFSCVVGVVLGCLYCVFVKENSEIYDYMQSFITTVRGGADKGAVFRKAFVDGVISSAIIVGCVFVYIGFVPICFVGGIRGFTVGFTFSAFFKYLGERGILLILTQLGGKVITFSIIIILGGICAYMSTQRRDRRVALKCALLLIAAVLLCAIEAVFEGGIQTVLLEMAANKVF